MPNKYDKCRKTSDDNNKTCQNKRDISCEHTQNGFADNKNELANTHNRRVEGKIIKKQSVITELVNDVYTQVNTNTKNEPIVWTKIQKIFTDKCERSLAIAIIIGLEKGFQIFLMVNNDFEEVLSVRKTALKNGHILPLKTERNDKLIEHRPIFAAVFDEIASEPYDTVNLSSLRNGKLISRVKLDNQLLDLSSSESCFLIASITTIYIINHEDLSERTRIGLSTSPIFSLSGNLCAFVAEKLDHHIQSCGITNDDRLVINNQVITTAKNITKTVTSIGGSLVSTTLGTSPRMNSAEMIKKKMGIVSVVNIDQHFKSHNKDASDYVAHFCAHSHSKVSHIVFGHGGSTLLTGSNSSRIFNLFLLHLHPSKCALTTIQHIYTLVRGNSMAKVINSSFSMDNRWVAISTNHGTTHLFAISPYGGPVTARTHRGKFMNKEGKFEKTTGIALPHKPISSKSSSQKSNPFRIHPGTRNNTISSTVINANATLHFDNKPIVLNSSILAKSRIFSPENLCAWASDNTPTILSANEKLNNKTNSKELLQKKAVSFVSFSKKKSPHTTILLSNVDGLLIQYDVIVTESTNQFKSAQPHQNDASINHDTPTSSITRNNNLTEDQYQKTNDCAFHTSLRQVTQWELTRNNGVIDFHAINPPLHPNNALIKLCSSNMGKESLPFEKQSGSGKSEWLQFIEMSTYMVPHRRLWSGPQFNFNVHSAKRNRPMGKRVTQVDGMQKCCPVMIERENLDRMDVPEVTKIICGSWSSEADSKIDTGVGLLKEKIDDAMKETNQKILMRDADVESTTGPIEDSEDLMTLSGLDI